MMEESNKRILNLDNWKEVTKGLYRYVIASNVCYEIHVLYRPFEGSIEFAESNLYIVGDFTDDFHKSFFSRECLLENAPLKYCLMCAYEDYKDINKDS